MAFNIESSNSSKNPEVPEVPEAPEVPGVKENREQISETENTTGKYDDCFIEAQEGLGNEANENALERTGESTEDFRDCFVGAQEGKEEASADSLEKAKENYEECAAEKEKMKEKDPECAENKNGLQDCGKEISGEYAAEVTVSTDGKMSEQEVEAQLQKAYDKCSDPENMQELMDRANENEHVEVYSAELVEKPEIKEIEKELSQAEYEEAQKKLDDAQEELESQQEAAWENQRNEENKSRSFEDKKTERNENTAIQDPERSGAGEEIEKTEDNTEHTSEENHEAEKMYEGPESKQPERMAEEAERSLQERVDRALEKEDVSSTEIKKLKEENAVELKEKIQEKSVMESELRNKFEAVLSKESGTEEYKRSLQEYNALQHQKMMLDEQIAAMEKQQDLLNIKSLELRDAQIIKGEKAVAASAATLIGVNELQERYDHSYYEKKLDKKELARIREDSCPVIMELSDEKDSIKQAMDAKWEEIASYVTSHNMKSSETAHDPHYQQMSAEYALLEDRFDKLNYSIVKLDENNKAITEKLGDSYISFTELSPKSEIAEMNKDTDAPVNQENSTNDTSENKMDGDYQATQDDVSNATNELLQGENVQENSSNEKIKADIEELLSLKEQLLAYKQKQVEAADQCCDAAENTINDAAENTINKEEAEITEVPKLEEISEWLSEINPNYDPFDWQSPYSNNCGSCAFAVEQRLNGNDTIVATSENIGTIDEMNKATDMEQVAMSPDEIRDYLIAQGPGSHGIVGIDRIFGPGHWFNAYYDGEKVVAIDGQTGEINDWPPYYGKVKNWDFSIRREKA